MVYVYVPNAFVLHIGNPFFFGRAPILALLASGHTKGPSLRRARSGRSRSRRTGFFRGVAFEPEPMRSMEAPNCHYFCIFSRMFRSVAVSEVSPQPSKARQPRYNSSRASSISLCDSHERCVCVWVRVGACVRVSS